MPEPVTREPIVIPDTPGPALSRVRRADPSQSDQQLQQFDRYRTILLAWNEHVNLTAITDPLAVELVLLLDAVRLAAALDPFLMAYPNRSARLVDIGTGAGFPGLALKIARPALDVTLLDATGKKIAFLNTVIEDLGLTGIRTHQGRAEEVAFDREFRERFDIATARALSSLPALMELCMPFVKPDGRGYFPKQAELGREFAEGSKAATIVGAQMADSILLPHDEDEPVTRLVIVDKLWPTPKRYPRRTGLPSREPLGRS